MTDSNTKTHIYEGLFLFSQAAAGDLQSALNHVTDLLGRAKADVVSLRKWDERRLAYEIKGNKRGVYFLSYFRAAPDALIGLERDCNLSESILRSMVTRADHIPSETIEAAEGRAQLADEIKLRSEAPPPSTAATAVVTVGGPKTEAAAGGEAGADSEKADKADKADKVDKVDKAEKAEKAEKVEVAE